MPSYSVRRYKRPTEGCHKVTLKELFVVKIEVFFNTYSDITFQTCFSFLLSFFRGQWKDDTIRMDSVFFCDCFMCNNSGVLIIKNI